MTTTHAQSPLGYTIQINTTFKSIIGTPTWLVIVRDETTGKIFPHIYDIQKENNAWVIFTYSPTYRITVSNLKFGPYAVIRNFCGLENISLTGKSLAVTITGNLTPAENTVKCRVMKF